MLRLRLIFFSMDYRIWLLLLCFGYLPILGIMILHGLVDPMKLYTLLVSICMWIIVLLFVMEREYYPKPVKIVELNVKLWGWGYKDNKEVWGQLLRNKLYREQLGTLLILSGCSGILISSLYVILGGTLYDPIVLYNIPIEVALIVVGVILLAKK